MDKCLFSGSDLKLLQVRQVASTQGFLVEFLLARGLVDRRTLDGQEVYKVAGQGELEVVFEETDVGVLRLQATLAGLQGELEVLEQELGQQEGRVRLAVREGKRVQAKSYLKRQKQVETSIGRKLEQIRSLETILESVVAAESGRSVVEAYRAGVGALHAALGDTSLEDVDCLMGEVEEGLAMGEGLGLMLSGSRGKGDQEQEALEQELEALAKEGEQEEQERDLLAELEQLTVHDSSLEPVIVPKVKKQEGRSPVAL